MGVVDGYNASTLQFVVNALRTSTGSAAPLDLTKESDRKKINTDRDAVQKTGQLAIRNADGTPLTIAQIATAANLTVAQVTDIAGRI